MSVMENGSASAPERYVFSFNMFRCSVREQWAEFVLKLFPCVSFLQCSRACRWKPACLDTTAVTPMEPGEYNYSIHLTTVAEKAAQLISIIWCKYYWENELDVQEVTCSVVSVKFGYVFVEAASVLLGSKVCVHTLKPISYRLRATNTADSVGDSALCSLHCLWSLHRMISFLFFLDWHYFVLLKCIKAKISVGALWTMETRKETAY